MPSAYNLASCSCFDESEKNPLSHMLDVVDKRFVIYFSVSEFKLSKISPVASIAQGVAKRKSKQMKLIVKGKKKVYENVCMSASFLFQDLSCSYIS